LKFYQLPKNLVFFKAHIIFCYFKNDYKDAVEAVVVEVAAAAAAALESLLDALL